MCHLNKTKFYLSVFLLSLMKTSVLFSQINAEDPFEGAYLLGGSSELFLIDGSPINYQDNTDQRLISMIIDTDSSIIKDGLDLSYFDVDTAELGFYGGTNSPSPMAAAVADFNSDGNDDVVAVWEGPDKSITGMIPHIDPLTLSWSEKSTFTTKNTEWPLLNKHHDIPDFEGGSTMRLGAGQVDNDDALEFILAYWAKDTTSGGSVQLLKYDVNPADLTAAVSASNLETHIGLVPSNTSTGENANGWFDLIVKDIDDDGLDEIILATYEPGTVNGSSEYDWQLVLRIFDGDLNLLFQSGDALVSGNAQTGNFISRLAITAADFDGDTNTELAIGYNLINNTSYANANNFSYIQVLALNNSLDDFSKIGEAKLVNSRSGYLDYPLTIDAYDFDFDGKTEIVFSSIENFAIYRANENLVVGDTLTSIDMSEYVASGQIHPKIFTVADMDVLGGDPIAAEILIGGPSYLHVYQVKQKGNGLSNTLIEDFMVPAPRGQSISYTMIMADFDGDAIRLGSPTRQRQSDIIQPLVVLNAPPIHFDVLDSTIYDIDKCFDGDCEHKATYVNTQNISTEVTATVSADWGFSKSITGSAGTELGPLAAHVENTLEKRYGQGFSNVAGSQQNYQITVSTEAVDDDRIYVTKSSYDILEYPVYGKNGLQGYVSAVIPTSLGTGILDNTWMSAKSGGASDFLLNHEVGNILSYPKSAEVPPGAKLFGRGNSNSFVLDPSAKSSWFLLFSQTEDSLQEQNSYQQISRDRTQGFAVGYGPFSANLEASVKDEYNSNEISTQKITVSGETSVEVEFGTIDGTILGNDTYEVSPFMYWTEGGTLVLDYAVEPVLTIPRVASWWEQSYSHKLDLSFILPWRNDEAKGLGSSNPEVQGEETRDIAFSVENPGPGEIITISARIHNFSLKASVTSSTAAFYLNDPDKNGVLIGLQPFIVPASREDIVVQLSNWQIPMDINGNDKIYVVLDQNNSIDEVHEDNNKGWRTLNRRLAPATGIDTKDKKEQPVAFQLMQNYPNPFNPTTMIEYTVRAQNSVPHVNLSIYNLLGQKVATLVDKKQTAGHYSVQWDASGYPSGVYIYQIKTEMGFKKSRKLILLK